MKRILTLDFPEAGAPDVGSWLAAVQDARRRTLEALDGLAEEALERASPTSRNSVASLLYHVAVIEADWLFSEILEGGKPFPEALFPFDVREEDGRLTPVIGVSLASHLERLASVRAMLLEELRDMDVGEFRRARSLPDYDVSAEWVLHHLLQHEAEHRAQIAEIIAGHR